jgi:hypothetical protein
MVDAVSISETAIAKLARRDTINLANLSPADFDKIVHKLINYHTDAEAFVALTVLDTPAPGEDQQLVELQRGILYVLLTETGPGASHTPAELADTLSERNRKLLRQAGRMLVAKNAITAETEPSDNPEGERVLAYAPTKIIEIAFQEYLDARYNVPEGDTLEFEAAAAVKQ